MEDKAASLPQMITRSGRSVGSGQLVDSEVFHRHQDRQPSTTAPLAAYPTAEEEDKESTESYTSATAGPTQPVSSLPLGSEFNNIVGLIKRRK